VTIPTNEPRPSVANARRIIASLVAERQALQSVGAGDASLEANRRALAYWQERLERALTEPEHGGSS
jgi:hypothetical protein